MDFDTILNSNLITNTETNIKTEILPEIITGGGENIIIDNKICNDEKKKECIIPKIDIVNKITKDSKDNKDNKDSNTGKIPDDKVDIVIKSCKNITSKQALLIIPITKYFSERQRLNQLITILKGEMVSLRLIDWFVTNFCKKYNIIYNVNDFRPISEGQTDEQRKSFDNFIIVHNNYKGQLKAYSKKNFDPFCRRNRIRFYYEDNKYFITTVGQLNFFKWSLENNIIDYIKVHIKEIEDDMNLRCENIRKTGTKINPTTGLQSTDDTTKKHKPYDGIIPIETVIKTRKSGGTRKKRKELSASNGRSLSIHKVPTTLIFD